MKYFKDWTKFELIWLFSFSIINIYLFYAWNDTVTGLLASLTGMICVVMVAKGKIENYYFGLVNIVLYAYISYTNKYYGEVMLNLGYYLPMTFAGIYLWKKAYSDVKVKVRMLSFTQNVFLAFGTLTAWLLYAEVLTYMKGNSPYLDSLSTVLSVIAMILMAFRFVEQWILWIIVDVVSIIMWVLIFAKGGTDISMIVMWSAYTINAFFGLYSWYMRYRDQNTIYSSLYHASS